MQIRARSRAHKRVNPGNRSCRGSMLRLSFEIGSTRQQYMSRTVVPADSRQLYDKTVSDSVDKPMRPAFDWARLAKRIPPGERIRLAGLPCFRSSDRASTGQRWGTEARAPAPEPAIGSS